MPELASAASAADPAARTRSLLGWIVAAWAVLAAAGVMALLRPDALGAAHPVSFTRAFFTSIDAATASGFSQQFARAEDFSPFVQWILSFETTAGLLLSLIAGGVILSAVFELALPPKRIAGAAAAMVGAAALAGVLTRVGDSTSLSMYRGICALAAAGPTQQLPGWSALQNKLVVTPLALLGSLGALPIAFLLMRGDPPARWRQHFRSVVAVAAGVYVVGLIVNAAQFVIDGSTFRSSILAANGVTLAAHGLGVSVDFASTWPRGVVWTAIAISVIGVGTLGASSSVGFAWLATFPRTLCPLVLRLLALQAIAGFLTLLVLLHTEPQLPAERIAMLVVSAAAKTGLSHEPVSITGGGLIALSLLMTFCKLLPLAFLGTQRPRIQPLVASSI